MNKRTIDNKGIVAGVLLALFTVISIISAINYYNNHHFYSSFFEAYWLRMLEWAVMILFAISLFTDNTNLAKTSRILGLILSVIDLVWFLVDYLGGNYYFIERSGTFFVSNLIEFLPSLFLLLAFTTLGKKGMMYCFVAIGADILSAVLGNITFIEYGQKIFQGIWPNIIYYAAIAMTAFYVADKSSQFNISNKTATSELRESMGNADNLLAVKKLLDDGIITQEEFDAKKKQLLGL